MEQQNETITEHGYQTEDDSVKKRSVEELLQIMQEQEEKK